MNAKKSLKISLNRETLVNLDRQALGGALGGRIRMTGPSCQEDCPTLLAASCGC